MSKRTHILITALCMLSVCTYAQSDGLNGEIVIVRPVQNNVAEGSKLPVPLNNTEEASTVAEQNYEVPNRLLKLNYEPNNLKPLKLPDEKSIVKRNNYIEVGFGYLLSPLANASYNYLKNENLNAGVNLHHFSAKASRQNQRMSETDLDAHLAFRIKKNETGFNLMWNNDVHHFYGYADTESYAKDSVRQNINRYGGAIFSHNFLPGKKKWNYAVNVPITFLKNADSLHELHTGAGLHIDKWMKPYHKFEVDVQYDFYGLKNAVQTNRHVSRFGLGYQLTGNDLHLKATLGAGGTGSAYYLLPGISAEYKLYKDYLVIAAGWNRKLQVHAFESLIEENPYMLNDVAIRNTRIEELSVEVKGALGDVDYQAGFTKRNFRNAPLFFQSATDLKRFDIYYEHRLQVLDFGVSAAYTLDERLAILAKANYSIYNTDSAQHAWNMPALAADLGVIYNFKNKVDARLDIVVKQGLYGHLADGTDRKLKGAVDINLRGNYHIGKLFTAFLQFNNLASVKAEKFPNYPTFGFNAIAGIKFKF